MLNRVLTLELPSGNDTLYFYSHFIAVASDRAMLTFKGMVKYKHTMCLEGGELEIFSERP